MEELNRASRVVIEHICPVQEISSSARPMVLD